MFRRRHLCVAIFGCVPFSVLLAESALAQQSRSDSSQLEEVVVTAERRESTVQTTPMSLTAVSGADIEERGLTQLSNLVLSVPGVALHTSGPGMDEFEMRGVASVGGNSPTVGFYYDDISLTAPAASNEGKIVISPALYDLNRVEVLRGPQGTLYGSGSMGGTIKVVPNPPNPEAFDFSAESSLGNTQGGSINYTENGMVNLPFGDGLGALRIVGSFEHDSGWVDRVVIEPGDFPNATGAGCAPFTGCVRGNVLAAPVETVHSNVNDVDRSTVRASILLKPIEGLSITPSVFYQHLRAGGLPYVDSNPGTDATYQPFDVSEAYHDDFKLGALNVKYGTQAFELTSTTAYWSRSEPLRQDTTESWTTAFGLTTYLPAQGGLGPSVAIEYNPSHQTTEELRLASVGDTKLKWLIGYYYSDFYSAWNITFPSTAPFGVPPSTDLFSYYTPMPILQQSEFGELTYNITEPFAVTVGLRHYHYDARVRLDQFGSITPTFMESVSDTEQGITPKVSASYDVSKDFMLYATAAKGFRPGGGTGPVPTSGQISCEAQLQTEYGSTGFVQGPVTFNSDHVWSYELGEKFRTPDKRVTINASAYFESWIGVQQVNSLSSCGYTYTANAGNAHVKGAELEIEAIVVPGLVVSANGGYADAALVSSSLIDAGFNPGTPIQDVPRWTSGAWIAYRHPLADQLGFTARVDNTYVASRTDATYSINTLPSYDLTNVRSGVEADHWSAVLFVTNIANKRAVLNDAIQDAVNLPTLNRWVISQPRTYGVDFNYRFGK
jgi:iron complex outermembrane receptor protein